MLQLRKLRASIGKKQIEVANELGLSRQAYGNYESGRRTPDIDTIKSMAHYFGVTIDQLLGKEQPSTQWDLQLFSNNARVAELSGEILSMKDDKKIALTVDILNRIKTMSTDQIEALNLFLSKVK